MSCVYYYHVGKTCSMACNLILHMFASCVSLPGNVKTTLNDCFSINISYFPLLHSLTGGTPAGPSDHFRTLIILPDTVHAFHLFACMICQKKCAWDMIDFGWFWKEGAELYEQSTPFPSLSCAKGASLRISDLGPHVTEHWGCQWLPSFGSNTTSFQEISPKTGVPRLHCCHVCYSVK